MFRESVRVAGFRLVDPPRSPTPPETPDRRRETHGRGDRATTEHRECASSDVARRFARGETATLELDGGGEIYDVRPDLTWARGPDGTPTVADASIRDVVFEE